MKVVATNNAPAAIGPYSQAMILNDVLFTSGQIPINPATGDIEGTDIQAQAEQVMKNLGAVLEAAGTSFENVVKTTCFLADMNDFSVVTRKNRSSQAYAHVFSANFAADCVKNPCRATARLRIFALSATKLCSKIRTHFL